MNVTARLFSSYESQRFTVRNKESLISAVALFFAVSKGVSCRIELAVGDGSYWLPVDGVTFYKTSSTFELYTFWPLVSNAVQKAIDLSEMIDECQLVDIIELSDNTNNIVLSSNVIPFSQYR